MQSNTAKAAVAIGSLALIVVLFVVFSGGDDDGETAQPVDAAATTTTGVPPADGAESDEPEEKPAKPEFETIVVEGGEPRGGVADLSYRKGDRVRLEVKSDVDEHVHVHGYDLFEDVAAGGKARFSFVADIDGVFEIELEDSAVELAQLTVKP